MSHDHSRNAVILNASLPSELRKWVTELQLARLGLGYLNQLANTYNTIYYL